MIFRNHSTSLVARLVLGSRANDFIGSVNGYNSPSPLAWKGAMMSSRSLVCITILVLMFCVAAFAQVTTADIVGRVTDTSGAVLPGVTVTAENLATHSS